MEMQQQAKTIKTYVQVICLPFIFLKLLISIFVFSGFVRKTYPKICVNFTQL